jgi:hypothetical protein
VLAAFDRTQSMRAAECSSGFGQVFDRDQDVVDFHAGLRF